MRQVTSSDQSGSAVICHLTPLPVVPECCLSVASCRQAACTGKQLAACTDQCHKTCYLCQSKKWIPSQMSRLSAGNMGLCKMKRRVHTRKYPCLCIGFRLLLWGQMCSYQLPQPSRRRACHDRTECQHLLT